MAQGERQVKDMNKEKFHYKKNTGFFIIILLFVIAFLGIGAYRVKDNVIAQINDTSYDYLLSTTEIVESKVVSSLEKDVQKLNYLSESILFDHNTLKYALREFTRNNDLYSTFYLDMDGKGIDHNDDTIDFSYIKNEETAISKGESSISPAYMNEAGDTIVLIQTPVYRNNVQKGALYCEVMVQRYYTNELFAFQEGKGRTFIVNSEDGAWLLKSPASDMIKLNDDGLYATIKENGNNDSTVKQLKDSIAKQKTGVFEIQGNDATLILCTTPVHEINDWQIVTIMRADMFATQIAQVERNTVFIVVLLIAMILVSIITIYLIFHGQRKKYRDQLENQYQMEKDAIEMMNREIIMRNCDFSVCVDLDEALCSVKIYHDNNEKANLFHDTYDQALRAYSKEIYMDDVDEFIETFTLSSLKKAYHEHKEIKHIHYRIMSDETLWYECYSICYYQKDHHYVYLFHRNISQEMKQQIQLIQEKYH